MFPTPSELGFSLRRAFGLALEFATLGELIYEPAEPRPHATPRRAAGSRESVTSSEAAAGPVPRPAPPASLTPATAAARRALEARAAAQRAEEERLARACPHAGRTALPRSRALPKRKRYGQPKPLPQPCLWAESR